MHVEKKKKKTAEDWGRLMVVPVVEEDGGKPVWAGLVSPGNGWKHVLTVRADDAAAACVEELQEAVPGLSESAALRFLLAVGLETWRAVDSYAPAVVAAMVRKDDPAGLNVSRLASAVCPIAVNTIRAAANGEAV